VAAVEESLPRQRRTQGQRRAITRAKITSAALEALAANGYAAMTFADVAERAGVSRGALLHYFPQKPDLALAAIEDGAVTLVRDVRARIEAIRDRADSDARVLDVIYTSYTGPLFQAFLALQVHARTDPDLNARLERLANDAVQGIGTAAVEAWGPPSLQRHPDLPVYMWLVSDVVRGISLASASDRADTDNDVWRMATPLLLSALAKLRETVQDH
jgi:AcrR family transcriptional regulator